MLRQLRSAIYGRLAALRSTAASSVRSGLAWLRLATRAASLSANLPALPGSSADGDRPLGADGERLAARHLQQLGYRILARGHRQRLGEVDLIALDGSVLVFVEVKTWRYGSAGDPSEAVDARKQERLTRAALIYLKRRNLLEQSVRFDVVSIVWPDRRVKPEIRHFINAFEAVGKWQMYR
jgi:putative endonuclease